MPTYLIHGFRWPRPLIRIHIILQNLDDAAAEWLMAPSTSNTMIANFKTLYPDSMAALPNLRFLEQYDPADDSVKSQPFAYVADIVEEVRLGLDIDEVRGKGVGAEAWSALVELRDKIAPGEKVAWFIVVCGDTERWAPPTVGLLEGSNRAPSAYGSQSNGSMSNFDAREVDVSTCYSTASIIGLICNDRIARYAHQPQGRNLLGCGNFSRRKTRPRKGRDRTAKDKIHRRHHHLRTASLQALQCRIPPTLPTKHHISPPRRMRLAPPSVVFSAVTPQRQTVAYKERATSRHRRCRMV